MRTSAEPADASDANRPPVPRQPAKQSNRVQQAGSLFRLLPAQVEPHVARHTALVFRDGGTQLEAPRLQLALEERMGTACSARETLGPVAVPGRDRAAAV